MSRTNLKINRYNMDGSSPTEFSDLLTLSTDSIGAIEEQQDVITVHYGNGIIKFPSKVTFNDVNWTLNCYCEPNVLDALKAWRNQIYNGQTEVMGLPSQYLRCVYVIRYDGQGNQRSVLKCPGSWIGTLNYGDMNQTGGSLVQVSVQFIISKAIYLTADEL